MTRFRTSLFVVFVVYFVLFLYPADAQKKIKTGQQIAELVTIGAGDSSAKVTQSTQDPGFTSDGTVLMDQFKQAEVVFHGIFLERESVSKDSNGTMWFRVTFNIWRSYKGLGNQEEGKVVVFLPESISPLENNKEQRYLILAEKQKVPAPAEAFVLSSGQTIIVNRCISMALVGQWLLDDNLTIEAQKPLPR